MLTKIRKGSISINQMLILALTFLGAGLLITVGTQSSLAQAANHGSDLIMQNTEYRIEIQDPAQLSDLALFVNHRAHNCGQVNEQNNQGGYPGLADSYLGTYPKCFGADGTAARGIFANTLEEQGQDSEGRYGHEKFVITGDEPVTIDASQSEPWLNNNYLGAYEEGFAEIASRECNIAGEPIPGSRTNYNLFFRPQPPESRASTWVTQQIGENEHPYCLDTPQDVINVITGYDSDANVRLCPGDEGYVQMNKGNAEGAILNDGESSVPVGEEGAGSAGYYGHIVITKLGEDCTGGGGDNSDSGSGQIQPYSGPTAGTQIYIGRDGTVQSGGNDLPQVETLEFRNEGNLVDGVDSSRSPDPNYDDDEVLDYEASSSRCQVVFSGNSAPASHEYYLTYGTGTKIDKTGSFTSYSSFADFHSDEPEAVTVYENFNMDGQELSGGVGSLRVNYQGGGGVNEMYGEMLCANPNNQNFAQWYLCDESRYDSETTISVGAGEWTCTPSSGEWEKTGTSDIGNARSALSSPYDSYEPREQESGVVSRQGNSLAFNPAQSTDQHDRMLWRSSINSEELKTIEFELEFSRRGHIRIQTLSESGGDRSALFFEARGQNIVFIDDGDDETDNQQVANYQTGTTYTIRITEEPTDSRGSRQVTWYMNGQELWSGTQNRIGGLNLESWYQYCGRNCVETQAPEVNIGDVRVEAQGSGGKNAEISNIDTRIEGSGVVDRARDILPGIGGGSSGDIFVADVTLDNTGSEYGEFEAGLRFNQNNPPNPSAEVMYLDVGQSGSSEVAEEFSEFDDCTVEILAFYETEANEREVVDTQTFDATSTDGYNGQC